MVDTDGDGLTDIEEITLYGTSPVLADTDGDGVSDYDEIVQKVFDPETAPLRFNPRVADLPLLEVEIFWPPLISFVVTDATGESRTFGMTQIWEEAVTTTDSATAGVTEGATDVETANVTEQGAVTRQVAVTTQTDGTEAPPRDARAEAGGDGDRARKERAEDDGDGPVTVTLTLGNTDSTGVSFTTARSRSTEVSLAFTQSLARTLLQAIERAESYGETHDVVASSGVILVLATLRNRGNVSFVVSNLMLTATLELGDGTVLPVGNLDLLTRLTTFDPFSLAPGETAGPINFLREGLTLEQMSTVLGSLSALNVRVGVTELKDADERAFVFDAPTIRGRTATVDVDYGDDAEPERHLVATNLDPAKPGVDTRRVFDQILRLPLACDPEGGLVSVRAVGAAEEGAAPWCAYHRRSGGAEETPYCPYDCSEIELRAGDALRLTRSKP